MKSKLTTYLITLVLTTFVTIPVKAAVFTDNYANQQTLNSEIGYNLTSKNTALIVIDVQKNFIPGLPECFMTEIPGQNTPNKLANLKKLII